MSRQRKIEIAVTVGSWLLGALLQAASFGYFFGRLTQKVEDLDKTVQGLIEKKYEVKR